MAIKCGKISCEICRKITGSIAEMRIAGVGEFTCIKSYGEAIRGIHEEVKKEITKKGNGKEKEIRKEKAFEKAYKAYKKKERATL